MTIQSTSTTRIGRRASRRAFTLIELLTVIAIIGILAAILIPVVGQVRESAYRAQCASNLRQMALAILAHDSELGVLPGPTRRLVHSPLNPTRPGWNVPRAQWPDTNVDMSLLIEDYLGITYHENDVGMFECVSSQETTMGNADRPIFLLNRRSSAAAGNTFLRLPLETCHSEFAPSTSIGFRLPGQASNRAA